MEVIHDRVAGLDVHKKTVAVCIRTLGKRGDVHREVRTFATITKELTALKQWLLQKKVTQVAMESTGVYWKPVWNILEDERFTLLLVNAQHIKQVPGRKTDIKDCEWIAQLLQHGLVKASFVPSRSLRELRDLTRHRAKLVGHASATANRIQKVLEDANIKLSSVASNVLGTSGRAMLTALVEGQDQPEVLAEMARARLRNKIPQLQSALEGRVTAHHRYMLETLLEEFDFQETMIAKVSQRIEELMVPFKETVQLLMTLPGVQQCTAENLTAEMGADMNQFASGKHLSSWAGICPGNNESAGKRKHGKTPKGNRWLRRALTQAAWAASHTKETYFSSQYHRLAGRRGKKRAVVAVGHSMLESIYEMLSKEVAYQELGPRHFETLHAERIKKQMIRRLEGFGYKVNLEPVEAVA